MITILLTQLKKKENELESKAAYSIQSNPTIHRGWTAQHRRGWGQKTRKVMFAFAESYNININIEGAVEWPGNGMERE